MKAGQAGSAAAWRPLAAALLSAAAVAAAAAETGPQPRRIDYDMQALARPAAASADARDGRRLFAEYCAVCHDPVGQPTHATYGPVLSPALLAALGDAAARAMILSGTAHMPGFQYQLRRGEVDHLLVFLRGSADTAVSADASTHTGAAATAILQGRVTTSAGVSVAGVAVSARAAGRTVTTTVFSDAAGRYAFPPLARGRYRLWAQTVGYEAVPRALDLPADGLRSLPLRLAALRRDQDVLAQASSGEWLESLPARTPQERRLREILRLNCEECHALSIPLQRRFDAHGWAAVIELMGQMDYDGWHGTPDPEHPRGDSTGALNEMNRHYAAELAEYLAAVRGPKSPPMRVQPLPRPTGAAARVVITGYDVPTAAASHDLSWHDGHLWSQGAASGTHGAVGVHDLVVDRQGNAWATEQANEDGRQLVKIDAASGQVSAFDFPANERSATLDFRTHGIGLDPQGKVWFSIDQTLAMLDPESGRFEQFMPPRALLDAMGSLTTDSDPKGKIWTDGVPGIMRFDPETATFTHYDNERPIPTFFYSYGVTGDAAGNGWWTVAIADRVETVDVQSGKTTELPIRPPWAASEESLATDADRAFQVPIGAGRQWGVYKPGAQFPRRLGADKNGTAIWVPNYWGRNLAKIDAVTKQITYYRLPIDAHPYFVKVDGHHVVWMNFESDDLVASFDPGPESWTFYRLPINGCESRNLALDERSGDVWVACYRASKVFRLHFRDAEP